MIEEDDIASPDEDDDHPNQCQSCCQWFHDDDYVNYYDKCQGCSEGGDLD